VSAPVRPHMQQRLHLPRQASRTCMHIAHLAPCEPVHAGTHRDVVTKIKDTATSAVESLTAPKPNAPEQRQRQQQDRRAAPLYRPREGEARSLHGWVGA
jgi:hypothetical protein